MTDKGKWEDALIAYSADASIGRLFKGLIHNLNGVGQAFSMQTELLAMMFSQADTALGFIEEAGSLDDVRERAAHLRVLMNKRSGLSNLLLKEVQILFDIMRRCSVVMEECRDPESIHSFKLRDVVRSEVEFQSANSFFKHKVNKKLSLAGDIPALSCHQVTLHKILSVFMENASQAMERGPIPAGDTAKLVVGSSLEGSTVRIDVCDNGPGVDQGIAGELFNPFVSGNGRMGLGLYLARVMAAKFSGSITFSSIPGDTCFSLTFPLEEVSVER